jgi:hypothetical protein
MTFNEFEVSLSLGTPPEGIHEVLLALWHEGRGDWEAAHNIAQIREGTRDYDHLHAYLHRVEGDDWNAGYWYRRAGVKMPDLALREEWHQLVERFLLMKN